MKLTDLLIVDPIDGSYTGEITIEGHKIKHVEKTGNDDFEHILMPGFADTHTHGCIGINTMYMDESDLKKWEEFLYSQGITFFLPTTVSAKKQDMKRVADLISNYRKNNKYTSVAGIHYEGPYINTDKKGAQNPSTIRESSIDELEEVLTEDVLLVTMAPEISNFYECSNYLRKKGIVVSLGHSSGNYSNFEKAFEHGTSRITHFPNALKGLHHREVGGVGAGFLLPFKLEMILDKFHTSREFVKLAFKIKGGDYIFLITDSIDATGLEDGLYDLGGLEVNVVDGKARLKGDDSIAGSTLLFSDGVRNFFRITNCSLAELVKVSSYNVLKNLNIENKGRILPDYDADLVLLSREMEVNKTIKMGKILFKQGGI